MGGSRMKRKAMSIIKLLFFLINMVQAGGISLFIYMTTKKICEDDQARVFLGQVDAIPKYPEMIVWSTLLLIALLGCDMLIRETRKEQSGKIIAITLGIDLVCSIVLVWILDFNYNGVILLVFANILVFVNDTKIKYLLIGVATLGYLVADYDLISVSNHLFSVRDYIQYYNEAQQQLLFSVYNILGSLNIMIFILYCINIINEQRNTIQEVNEWSRQLQYANDRLKEYNEMTEKMAETRERNRVAREIHDTLGHTLTGVSAGVDACIALVDIDPGQTKKQLEVIAKAVRGGIKDVRSSVSELRADALEHFQLDEAISDMIAEMNSLAGVEVVFHSEVKPFRFSEDEENVVYRIIQEGITNALRHGKATRIQIDARKIDGVLHLTIQDNGCGCKEIKKGFGTKHMKERVAMLGGSIHFSGENGFLIDARIPIRWGEEYD